MTGGQTKVWVTGIGLLYAASCFGALDHVELSDRTDVLGGKSFGTAGPYERLVGKAYFQVDPANPATSSSSMSTRRAQRKRDGWSSPPTFMSSNRASQRTATARSSSKSPTAAAKAWWARSIAPAAAPIRGPRRISAMTSCCKQGYTIVWLGWQFDVPATPGLMRLYAPSLPTTASPSRAWSAPNSLATSAPIPCRSRTATTGRMKSSTPTTPICSSRSATRRRDRAP